jgi:hypothetical protein
MNRVAKWVGAAVLALGSAAAAYADPYAMDFYDSASPSVIDATGMFTYNVALPAGSQFSNFTVDWSGNTFDFTTQANSTPVETHGDSASISFFTYLTSPAYISQLGSWIAESIGSAAEFILSPFDNPVASAAPSSGFNLPQTGTFSVRDTFQAPEIDPASAASGLTLLLGSLIVLRGRKQRHLAA